METPIELTNPAFHNEDEARFYIEAVRWPNGQICPVCGLGDQIKPLGGESMGSGWYHCGQCRDKFTVRSKSIFEHSHVLRRKWPLAFRLMSSSKKGMSAHQLHRSLSITYKTAWVMAMRIHEAMTDTAAAMLGENDGGGEAGIVEVDENYFGSKGEITRRTRKGKSKHGSKRSIVALVERGGKSHMSMLNQHETIHHSDGEFARGSVHTDTVEDYFSVFKRGMKGVYQHRGEQHLDRYATEFNFRYTNRVALGCADISARFARLRVQPANDWNINYLTAKKM